MIFPMFALQNEKHMLKFKELIISLLVVLIISGYVSFNKPSPIANEKLITLEKIEKERFPDVVEKVKIEQRIINSTDDILPIEGPKVKPVDYLNAISLAQLPVKEKKQRFVDLVLPAILIAKEEYKARLDWVRSVSKKDNMTPVEEEKLKKLMKDFRATSLQDLEKRLVTHPTSIVLAQASIESGWGTSRFFVQANNIFGVWSFNPDDPRIPTLSTRNGKRMYLYKYNTLSESVDDYFKLLATRKPFEQFRNARLKTQDPFKLVEYLDKYSERGEAYVEDLKAQIRHNNFTKYDSYTLDLGNK